MMRLNKTKTRDLEVYIYVIYIFQRATIRLVVDLSQQKETRKSE